jgi:hypothetical protein
VRFEILVAATTKVSAAPVMYAVDFCTDVSDEHVVSIVGIEQNRIMHFYTENGSS